jgi:hypothetical protein
MLFTACHQVVPDTGIILISPSEWPESRKLPPTPTEDVKVVDDRVAPVSAGSTAEFSGILLSEDKARRAAALKLRYDELLVLYSSDRKVWSTQREFYEEELKAADKKLKELQPGWYDQHKLELGVIGGMILTILSASLISRVTK